MRVVMRDACKSIGVFNVLWDGGQKKAVHYIIYLFIIFFIIVLFLQNYI